MTRVRPEDLTEAQLEQLLAERLQEGSDVNTIIASTKGGNNN